MRSPPARFGTLDDAQRDRLIAGEHEALAEELVAAEQYALAGWIQEQIWDFPRAQDSYERAGHPLEALRVAVAAGTDTALDRAFRALESVPAPTFDAALELLRTHKRHMEVARLLALRQAPPELQAEALMRAGNRLATAQAFAAAGRPHDAFKALAPDLDRSSAPMLGLAAHLSWDLGDAEGAARYAQAALRGPPHKHSVKWATLLARALGSLGHDLAAQLVLERHGAPPSSSTVPGRYQVTGLLPTPFAGSAYVGVDRRTLQEVEIHLMLSDQVDPIDPRIAAAIDRFVTVAQAASAIGHPAIRPVLRTDPAAGLLVLSRAEGPAIRHMIRPPGLADSVPRARALVAFLLEGLIAGHRRGLVHGAVLPSQIATDALGRPQLGPFGGYHLAGLAATRTEGLEELLVTTAPELRRRALPTPRSDLYAAGVLFHALLTGRLETPQPDPAITPAQQTLIASMTAEDPDQRCPATHALDQLRTPIADLRHLADSAQTATPRSSIENIRTTVDLGVEVVAAQSWEPEQLDALCACSNPWIQPILDRNDRSIILARWPEYARVLDASVPQWRALVPPEALDLPAPLRDALETRLRPCSIVVTAAGHRMLALDDLLSR